MKETTTRKSFRRIEEGSEEFNTIMAACPELKETFYAPNPAFVQVEEWVDLATEKKYEPPTPKLP